MKLLVAIRDTKNQAHEFRSEHADALVSAAPDWEIIISREKESIEAGAQSADIIAGFPATLPDILTRMPVRWVHSFSAGVDRVLTPAVRENPKIIVSNSSGIHATPIAEHVLGFLLFHTRRFHGAMELLERREWGKMQSATELRDKNVVVAGLGAIGSEVARLACAFGAHVTGITRTPHSPTSFVEQMVTSERLHQVLPNADFVCLCLPGGVQTDNYLSYAEFALMKRSAIVTNIGRGNSINQEALITALNSGTIAAALLDVTTPEPLPQNNPLWAAKNIFITAHYSGLSEKYMDRAIERFCQNIRAYRAGEPLPNEVNKELGY